MQLKIHDLADAKWWLVRSGYAPFRIGFTRRQFMCKRPTDGTTVLSVLWFVLGAWMGQPPGCSLEGGRL